MAFTSKLSVTRLTLSIPTVSLAPFLHSSTLQNPLCPAPLALCLLNFALAFARASTTIVIVSAGPILTSALTAVTPPTRLVTYSVALPTRLIFRRRIYGRTLGLQRRSLHLLPLSPTSLIPVLLPLLLRDVDEWRGRPQSRPLSMVATGGTVNYR